MDEHFQVNRLLINQVLKLKLQKLQKDNDDDSTQDCRFLRFTFTFLHDVQNIAPGHK